MNPVIQIPRNSIFAACRKIEEDLCFIPPRPVCKGEQRYSLLPMVIEDIENILLKNYPFQGPFVQSFKLRFLSRKLTYFKEQIKKSTSPFKNAVMDIVTKTEVCAYSYLLSKINGKAFSSALSGFKIEIGKYTSKLLLESQLPPQRKKKDVENIVIEIWGLASIYFVPEQGILLTSVQFVPGYKEVEKVERFKDKINGICEKLFDILEEERFWKAVQSLSKIEAVYHSRMFSYRKLIIAPEKEVINSIDMLDLSDLISPEISSSIVKKEEQPKADTSSSSSSSMVEEMEVEDTTQAHAFASILLQLNQVLPKALAKKTPIIINLNGDGEQSLSSKDAIQLNIPITQIKRAEHPKIPKPERKTREIELPQLEEEDNFMLTFTKELEGSEQAKSTPMETEMEETLRNEMGELHGFKGLF